VVRALIGADSLLLLARVLLRRVRVLARRAPRRDAPVLYVDCGTHRDAKEVRFALDALNDAAISVIAIEASADHLAAARAGFRDDPELSFVQLALVGPDETADTVKLFRCDDSRGDSLFPSRGAEFDLVPAGRLSDVLEKSSHDVREEPFILRMNIEGAEYGVLQDLVSSGLAEYVDGYYGMWDDLSKLDTELDVEFRAFLAAHHIRPVTFNNRDLDHRLRRLAIRIDLRTSVRRGRL
jgi:FkbM family methyltransferase